MSVQATAWAWSIRDLPPHLKITLLAIADACNAEGYGYPGQERLAHQVQCSDRQIRSNVAALVKRGLIAVIHRPGDGSGRRSNAYQLHLEHRQATGSPLPLATGSPAPGQPEVDRGATGSPTGGNRKSRLPPNVRKERQKERQRDCARCARTSPRPTPARPPVSTASGTPGPPATANAPARPPSPPGAPTTWRPRPT